MLNTNNEIEVNKEPNSLININETEIEENKENKKEILDSSNDDVSSDIENNNILSESGCHFKQNYRKIK